MSQQPSGTSSRPSSGDGSSSRPSSRGGQMRSDLTRPSRASHTGNTSSSSLLPSASSSTTASGAGRQPGSSAVGRAGRLSTGTIQQSSTAAGSTASRLPSASAVGSSTAAAGTVGPSRQPRDTTAAAAAAAGTAAQQQQPVPAHAAVASPAPITPHAYLQSNVLFGQQESSMTPSVRKHDYTPSLSPDMEQLAARAAAAAVGSRATTPAAGTGAITPRGGALQAAQQQQLMNGMSLTKQQQQQVHPSALAASKVPKSYLPTTGDLFAAPDQESAKEPLIVDVSGSQLISPAWNQSRPWLTGSWIMQFPPEFITEAGSTGTPSDPQLKPLRDLSALSPAEQEAALVDDLLTVFIGQAGEYITHAMVEAPKWQRLALRVQGVQDPSLIEQVERLLPLCECVYVIKRFVETRSRIDHPMVAQALAAAMRKLQEEWWLLVVQLEHQMMTGQLTLAGLVYYCQAPAASMELLASIAGEAADQGSLTSAGLLNLLAARQRSLAGDRPGQLLVGQLMEAAAEPYFGILRQWLCWGVLDDPYHEFMIKEDPDVGRDSLTPDGQPAYWSQRYRLRGAVHLTGPGAGAGGQEHDVPDFLASSKEAILITGKYLNVIRQCGQPVPPCPEATLDKLRYSAAASDSGSPPFLTGIQEALAAAAGALLGLMSGPEGRLMSWLHSLKHFFLLDQGDLLVHLLEQPELRQPPSSLASHQLQGLLDAALRSSSVAASPYIEVVGEGVLGGVMDKRSILQLVTAATCSMDGDGMVAGLQTEGSTSFPRDAKGAFSCGLEMLLLTVKLAWPLTLVVSRRQLLHYQVIFKQLLSLKWAERDLGQLWQGIRATKRLGKEDQARFRPWHLLCSQLLYVVCEVLRFTSIDVLEPLWGDMEEKLGQAVNMDEVIALHNAFLSAALERSLLTESRVVKHINVLLTASHELAKEAAGLMEEQEGSAGEAAAASRGPSAPVSRSSSSSKSGQQQQQEQTSSCTAVDRLKVMSSFCRDANRQAQLTSLQTKVDQVLQELIRDLNIHYQHLLTAAPAAAGCGLFCGSNSGAAAGLVGSVAGRLGGLVLDGGWGSGVGGFRAGSRGSVGDSSRELASLHNLIQRLELGCRMSGTLQQQQQQQQAWSAAY